MNNQRQIDHISFQYVQLSFEMVAQARGVINQYFPALIRSVIGKHLYNESCIRPLLSCQKCSFNASCPYGATFEPSSQFHNQSLTFKMRDLPPPFMIEVPSIPVDTIRKGQIIKINVKLYAHGIKFQSDFLKAMKMLSQSGIGKDRIPFTIIKMEDKSETIEIASGFTNSTTDGVIVRFVTPARIKHQGKLVFSLTKEIFAQMLVNRVSYLYDIYEIKEKPDLNADHLFKNITFTKVFEKTVHHERFSSRQQKSVHINGVEGMYILSGDLQNVISLLKIAQVFHVGKQTVLGLGQFELYERSH